MTNVWTWDEMLDEFRALGGVAENVVRREGGVAGRGLFAVDPSQPVRLHAPPNLLVPRDSVVFENGVLRIPQSAGIGAREARFLERYYGEFSWGDGGRKAVADFVAALDALPGEIRALLKAGFQAGWLFEGTGERRIERRFLHARAIRREGVPVMAPVVELANHAPSGASYALETGVGLGGRFAGEVFARYARTDPFQIFEAWGFASPAPLAFSLPVFVKLGARILAVRRRLDLRSEDLAERQPLAARASGRFVDLPYLLIASRDAPDRPRAVFARCMKEVGEPDADRVFDEIVALNRERLLALSAMADAKDDSGSAILRAVCRLQLNALAPDLGRRP